jgi:hypothetical protein
MHRGADLQVLFDRHLFENLATFRSRRDAGTDGEMRAWPDRSRAPYVSPLSLFKSRAFVARPFRDR